MNGPRIKSFAELKNELIKSGQISVGDAKPPQNVPEDEGFLKLLEKKLQNFPSGNFKSLLPGVESLTVYPFPVDAKDVPRSPKTALYIEVFWSQNGREQAEHFSVSGASGAVIGNVPKGLSFSKEELRAELKRVLESVDVSFWLQKNLGAVPLPDAKEYAEQGAGEKERRWKPVVDSERLEILQGHPATLFGVVDKSKGLNGYHFIVCRGGLIAESAITGNAAYIFKFDQPLNIPPEKLQRPKAERLTEEERSHIIEAYLLPLLMKASTRGEWQRRLGAERRVHAGEWKTRILDALNDLN